MDVQLKELIDKIKNDGVDAARQEAEQIIARAETQAVEILDTARNEAELLRKAARADADKFERSSREAVRQAGRNLVLTVKDEIQTMFARVMEQETSRAMSADVMADVVKAAVGSLGSENAGKFDVLVPEARMKELEAGLRAALAGQMSAGMEIRPFKGLDAGFRLGRKDGAVFYDFSAGEIAAMLGRYLNPALAALLAD